MKANEVNITRIFNAPRELVFDAWSSAEHLEKWYAPDGCSIRVKAFEFVEGMPFHHCITIPNGKDCWCIGTFLTIDRPNRLVYTLINADENGNALEDATEAGFEHEWPTTTTVTITFTADGDKTIMHLHQTVNEELAKRTGAYPSWLSMFDRLENRLTSHTV